MIEGIILDKPAFGYDVIIVVFILIAAAGIAVQIGRVMLEISAFIQHVWIETFGKNFHYYPGWEKKALPQDQRQFLFEQIHFYKFLSEQKRRAFDYRVIKFMKSRTFIAKEGVEFSKEMKLLISATSVQITFGLRRYMLKEFKKIIIFPDVYFNPKAQQHHKGEVDENGTVILSWKHFKEGIAIPDDNLNLGIHEFAHTLAVQRLNNVHFMDIYFTRAFDKLMKNVSNPVFRKRIVQRSQMRPYGMTNAMEFFAVATEYFFESPQELKRNHITIYRLFVEMFNQDLALHFSKEIQPLTHFIARSV